MAKPSKLSGSSPSLSSSFFWLSAGFWDAFFLSEPLRNMVFRNLSLLFNQDRFCVGFCVALLPSSAQPGLEPVMVDRPAQRVEKSSVMGSILPIASVLRASSGSMPGLPSSLLWAVTECDGSGRQYLHARTLSKISFAWSTRFILMVISIHRMRRSSL